MEKGNISQKRPYSIHYYNKDIQWVVVLGFLVLHLGALTAYWTGVTWRAVAMGTVLYWARMFAVTAGSHRLFAHRAYQTSRWFQFLMALGVAAAFHGGVLSWASRHRWHHAYSDKPEDFHSPKQYGFWTSHFGWLIYSKNVGYGEKGSKDFNRYPELIWLERWHWVVPLTLAVVCYLIGGLSGLIVGMGWSTILVFHISVSINSLSHLIGTQRYNTGDDSRNNWLLAILTMGEGWHNNHHYYHGSVRQGHYWWEIDLSYYILCGLRAVGLVWKFHAMPPEKLRQNLAGG